MANFYTCGWAVDVGKDFNGLVWPMPSGREKGEWVSAPGRGRRLSVYTMSDLVRLHHPQSGETLFLIEPWGAEPVPAPVSYDKTEIATFVTIGTGIRRGRVVRVIDNWTYAVALVFGIDCAERALRAFDDWLPEERSLWESCLGLARKFAGTVGVENARFGTIPKEVTKPLYDAADRVKKEIAELSILSDKEAALALIDALQGFSPDSAALHARNAMSAKALKVIPGSTDEQREEIDLSMRALWDEELNWQGAHLERLLGLG